MRVILENFEARKVVTVALWVSVGSRYEADYESGYAHFVEHMLFKSTKNRNYSQISREIDQLGGYMNASTEKEFTNYYITLNRRSIIKALEILSDMYFNSKFDPEEFTTEQKVILEEIKMTEDSPDELLHDLFYRDYFGDNEMGRSVGGTIASISESTREQLLNFYQNFYTPSNVVLSISGGLWKNSQEKHQLIAKIKSLFEEDNNFSTKKHILKKTPLARISKVYPKDLEQVHFILSIPGQKEEKVISPLDFIAQLMGGTMSSRLFLEMREKLGLCYSVGTFHNQYRFEGNWGIYCATSPKYFLQAVETAVSEFTKFFKESEKESKNDLEVALEGYVNSYELAMESTYKTSEYNAKTLLIHDEWLPWQETIPPKRNGEHFKSEAREFWGKDQFTITTLGSIDQIPNTTFNLI